MCKPVTDVLTPTQIPDPLARADALERQITDLCAQINAANYRLLQLIAELDDAGPWAAWGLASCAHWLNWRCGIGLNAAREKVRVAHALKHLSAISRAFEDGRLSFSKVRALTRVADSTNQAELLRLAQHATAAQVESLVRAYRRCDRLAEREQAMAKHTARELTYYHDDDGCIVIRARLPAAEGAVVLHALKAAMAVAVFRVARITAASRHTTFGTGPTAAQLRSTISCSCAGVTTAWCTRVGLVSSGSQMEACSSPGPTVVSSTFIRSYPPTAASRVCEIRLRVAIHSRSTHRNGLSPQAH